MHVLAIWVFGILSAVVLFTIIKFRKEWVTDTSLTARYDKLKVDVKAALFFLSFLFTIEIIYQDAEPSLQLLPNLFGNYIMRQGSWLVIFAIAIAYCVSACQLC